MLKYKKKGSLAVDYKQIKKSVTKKVKIMSEETVAVNNASKVEKEINTIPLKEVQKWAFRWAKKEGDYNKHH